MSQPVRITKQELEQKINEGWKKDALAEHYGLPMAQMTKVLQEAGLRIRKFHRPKFVLVDEAETEEVQDTQVNNETQNNEAVNESANNAVEESQTEVPQGW